MLGGAVSSVTSYVAGYFYASTKLEDGSSVQSLWVSEIYSYILKLTFFQIPEVATVHYKSYEADTNNANVTASTVITTKEITTDSPTNPTSVNTATVTEITTTTEVTPAENIATPTVIPKSKFTEMSFEVDPARTKGIPFSSGVVLIYVRC